MFDLDFPQCIVETPASTDFTICYPEDQTLQEALNDAITSLTPRGLAFFDGKLSEYEQWLLSQINVQQNEGTLDFCADLTTLPNEASKFLKDYALEKEDHGLANELSLVISKIAKNIIASSGHFDGEVVLSTFSSARSDYRPFWHIDKSHKELLKYGHDHSFPEAEKIFIYTLKGSTTLFPNTNNSTQNQFLQLAQTHGHLYGPSYLENYVPGRGIYGLFSAENSTVPEFGHGSIHIAGLNYGTIHASPPPNDRIILVVRPNNSTLLKQDLKKHIEAYNQKLAKHVLK